MNVFCPHCGCEFSVTRIASEQSKSAQASTQNCSESTQNRLSNYANLQENTANLRIVLSGSDPDQIGSGSGSRVRKFAYSTEFLTFWALYPKRRNKGDAWKAWRSTANLQLADLLNALSWQVHSPAWRKDDGQFIPYPATYIRARAWEDEPDSTAPSQKHDQREEERRSRPLARIPGT